MALDVGEACAGAPLPHCRRARHADAEGAMPGPMRRQHQRRLPMQAAAVAEEPRQLHSTWRLARRGTVVSALDQGAGGLTYPAHAAGEQETMPRIPCHNPSENKK